MPLAPRVVIIIVSHNSQQVLGRCIAGINAQTVGPVPVIIVDCGSDDTAYLGELSSRDGYTIHYTGNIGFAAANNLALKKVACLTEFVLLLNPDAFLESDAIAQGLRAMAAYPEAAICGGILKGYDLAAGRPSGRLDSTGVFRTWYGRWYDRDQGAAESSAASTEHVVPALCGALMFCRTAALRLEMPEVFDESFFMYKEDIDLCLRLRRRGWKLLIIPALQAFHCRGWGRQRRLISKEFRLLAARNEIRLTVKHRSPYLIWAAAKYLMVRVADV